MITNVNHFDGKSIKKQKALTLGTIIKNKTRVRFSETEVDTANFKGIPSFYAKKLNLTSLSTANF